MDRPVSGIGRSKPFLLFFYGLAQGFLRDALYKKDIFSNSIFLLISKIFPIYRYFRNLVRLLGKNEPLSMNPFFRMSPDSKMAFNLKRTLFHERVSSQEGSTPTISSKELLMDPQVCGWTILAWILLCGHYVIFFKNRDHDRD